MALMDTRIPLMGQGPDLVNVLANSTLAAQQQNQARQQNALAQLYQTQGPGIAAGETEALNALAQLSPEMALGIQDSRQTMDYRSTQMQALEQQMQMAREQARVEAEGRVSQMSAAEAAAEAQRLGMAIQSAYAMSDTPEGWAQALQMNGLDPSQYPFEMKDMFLAQVMGVKDAFDVRASMGPETADPQSAIAKLQADFNAGLISAEQLEMGMTALAPAGMSMRVNPDGTFEFAQGANAGGQFSDPVTPGQRAVDTAFAPTFIEWTQGGGADAMAQLAKINSVVAQLSDPASNLTGLFVGSVPDIANAVLNPEAVAARETVEEVVQRNLRLILGAQFTEKEGERLISRAYNPRLSPEENARRLRTLSTMMEAALASTQSQVDYFSQNGTLTGWEGPQYTIADFERAIEGDDETTSDDISPSERAANETPPAPSVPVETPSTPEAPEYNFPPASQVAAMTEDQIRAMFEETGGAGYWPEDVYEAAIARLQEIEAQRQGGAQ